MFGVSHLHREIKHLLHEILFFAISLSILPKNQIVIRGLRVLPHTLRLIPHTSHITLHRKMECGHGPNDPYCPHCPVDDSDGDPVFSTRLTRDDLTVPRQETVQVGEIFGNEVVWTEPRTMLLRWSANVNLDDQPGIELSHGGWGYAGWDQQESAYLRYDTSLGNNEHCFRILRGNDEDEMSIDEES